MMSVVGEPQIPGLTSSRTATAKIDIHQRIPPRDSSSALIYRKCKGYAFFAHGTEQLARMNPHARQDVGNCEYLDSDS
jgi:hypothetical protein